MYGKVQEAPQSGIMLFYPINPYVVEKIYAYWTPVNYREAYGMYAYNGMLFNHESPMRKETFVTHKITREASIITLGLQDKLYLRDLDAQRYWGHAKGFVRMMWMILQAVRLGDCNWKNTPDLKNYMNGIKNYIILFHFLSKILLTLNIVHGAR